ncbi:M3 family metallopeptidase [Limoniibacter endophyticus]|uniref:Peptidyl-dipeptidase Dcp n=1 Tax=Limoniibacter endophyticus TaxID=1565040 RepID=A0A8J3DPF3_9HYPH|nr:M3 family metallopeptidase [Limoniibacter endophyticus]GHC73894.1 peptidyl-dipeptidase Dcp [Limoniibacter endophyticus]
MSTIDLDRHPLVNWSAPHGLPDFDRINDDVFLDVFELALSAHRTEIDAIANSDEIPTIENTLKALELSGEALSRVSSIFWMRAGAHTNPTIQATERDLAPKLSRHYSAIALNQKLFARIDDLYARRSQIGLDDETNRALEKSWKGFMRSGAKLEGAARDRFAEINSCLASLGAAFGQNVLADESGWSLALTKDDLVGLPEPLIDGLVEAAQSREGNGDFVVTLSRSVAEGFLSHSARRDLREKVFRAFISRGEKQNWPLIQEMLALRAEKAKLLGYENFAAFKLDNTMAKTPQTVMELLMPVWQKALNKARAEEAVLAEIAADAGENEPLEGWDWRFYAERNREKNYQFDENALKAYFSLDRVIEASFDVASRLFGLSFEALPDVRGWHEDVRAFRVMDESGAEIGLFLADYYARASKRSGAWMSALRSAHGLDNGQKPIIYNVMNFSKPSKGKTALLSLDEARTLFHEFGHALHGLLTKAKWPSLAGTAVSRDFVELPSQLYEHWLMVPEVMTKHARHYKTNEPIPAVLIEKLKAAHSANAGFDAVEFTASALVDMAYHTLGAAPSDPKIFEAETLAKLDMPKTIAMRHRSPQFLHIFAGDGYSAGYYSYMWSEVLDADAFAAFEETGDPFDPETAHKLKECVYAAGDTQDPEALYRAFRGKMPSPEAVVKKRGLA